MEAGMEDDGGSSDLCTAVVNRFRNSNAPEHRHLCAIALAISEILKEQSLGPTPTACFAAAMSSLEKQMSTAPRDLAVTTGICTFLSMVLPHLPSAVLASKSTKTLQLLASICSLDGSVAATVKPALSCVSIALTAADKSNWPALASSFHLVLKHCIDQRPKVRKRAQSCMTNILSAFQDSTALAPASDAILGFFELSLKAVIRHPGKNVVKSTGNAGAVEVLHMIGGMSGMLPLMTGKTIGQILPLLINLIEVGQPLLTRRVLDTLQALCMSRDADIPPVVLGDALEALSSFFASSKKQDVDEIPVATRVIQHGFDRIYERDPQSCAQKLPTVFNTLADLFAVEKEEINYGAAECLRGLAMSCIGEAMIQQGVNRLKQGGQGPPSAIERICASAESLLGYQYSAAWAMVLSVVSALFEKVGPAAYVLMPGVLKTLSDLQNLDDQDLTCRKELHKAIGVAVEAMGPDHFLNLLPLEMDKTDLASSRIWLLPILKQHIVGARLGFFADTLFPLYNQLKQRSAKFAADGKPVAAKNAESCAESLWALLPSVCNYPADTDTKFRFIAKTLGDALEKEVGLRGLVCSSLQTLILQNRIARGDKLEDKRMLKVVEDMESGDQGPAFVRARALYTVEAASANLLAISAFSHKFLPLLFNVFLASPAASRGDLQTTIAAIASISKEEVVTSLYVKIMDKLRVATIEDATSKSKDAMQVDSVREEKNATSQRCAFMDLALSLVQPLDEKSLSTLLNSATPALQDKDGGVQKKAYKVIASICKEKPDFLSKKSEQILETLVSSVDSCHPSARRHRLNCVHYVIIRISKAEDEKKDEAIASLISEIILATKESNRKTRNTAYDLLIIIAHSAKELDHGNQKTNLTRYFNMILGCLAGTTPRMVSAAVASVARLIYEFASEFCYTVPDLLPSALLLLRSKNREIIKSVLGLVKVFIARLPATDLEQHLSTMVQGLMLWTDDSKNRFRAKVREIVERLVRRCGVNAVAAVMPPEHMKLLTNIRKKKEQVERKRKDHEDGETKSVKSRATTARKSAWNHTDVFSDSLDEADSEEEFDDTTKAATTTKSKTRVSNATRSNFAKKSAKRRLPEDVNNDDGDPLDLLDTGKTRKVLSVMKKVRQTDSDDEPDFDVEGRLIVNESNDKKRKRARGEMDDEEDDIKSRGSKSSRRTESRKETRKLRKDSNKRAKGWAYTGEDYANRKGNGGGDAKRLGKLDPYAYWPLDPKLLNRREAKRAAAREGMRSVLKKGGKKGRNGMKIGGGKKGTRKGSKAHKVRK